MNKNAVKAAWKVAMINLRTIKTPYFVAALLMGFNIFVISLTAIAISRWDTELSGDLMIATGGASFVLIVMAAIFIPAVNFRRICNLGGNRRSFFWGSLVAYVILACAASLADTAEYLGVNAFLNFVDSLDIGFSIVALHVRAGFGWTQNEIVLAFFRQAAYMFLLAAFVHALAAAQGKWYGWAANIGLVAIYAVFTAIAPLQVALDWFFTLIMYHPSALAQISSCVVLGLALYALSRPILARKAI
ncbi:MAG: hypothetical protein FWE09_09895 [Treponema sp.]|nr:hypothetical protein [Treponema sp.]